MKDETANVAKPMDADGELYQKRALSVLPMLVRQAATGQPVFYGAIAREVGMPNARNLNYVLGSIGKSLDLLRDDPRENWANDVPPIQALVVTEATGVPGDGFAGALTNPQRYLSAPRREKRRMMHALWGQIKAFPDWHKVLDYFGLEPVALPSLDELLPEKERKALGGAGESEAHIQFKQFIAEHPSYVGVTGRKITRRIEYIFASSDAVDVLFMTEARWVAVEVKAKASPLSDILRGLFQCVKYRALLDATIAVDDVPVEAKAILALEGSLPTELQWYANELGVEVFERVRERAGRDGHNGKVTDDEQGDTNDHVGRQALRASAAR